MSIKYESNRNVKINKERDVKKNSFHALELKLFISSHSLFRLLVSSSKQTASKRG